MSRSRLQQFLYNDLQHIFAEYGTDQLKLYRLEETPVDFYNESLEKNYDSGTRFFGYPVLIPKNEKTSDAGREKDVFLRIYLSSKEINKQGWNQIPLTDKDVIEFNGIKYDVLDMVPIGFVVDDFLFYKIECRNG